MKLTSIVKPSNLPFLSVVLALSLFSVLFLRYVNVLGQLHHVDTKTEQTSEPDLGKSGRPTADSISR